MFLRSTMILLRVGCIVFVSLRKTPSWIKWVRRPTWLFGERCSPNMKQNFLLYWCIYFLHYSCSCFHTCGVYALFLTLWHLPLFLLHLYPLMSNILLSLLILKYGKKKVLTLLVPFFLMHYWLFMSNLLVSSRSTLNDLVLDFSIIWDGRLGEHGKGIAIPIPIESDMRTMRACLRYFEISSTDVSHLGPFTTVGVGSCTMYWIISWFVYARTWISYDS